MVNRLASNGLECLSQVRLKIFDVLDADRQPQQTVHESDPQPVLAGNGRVRHRGRMANEALHASEALGAARGAQSVSAATSTFPDFRAPRARPAWPAPSRERTVPRGQRRMPDDAKRSGAMAPLLEDRRREVVRYFPPPMYLFMGDSGSGCFVPTPW